MKKRLQSNLAAYQRHFMLESEKREREVQLQTGSGNKKRDHLLGIQTNPTAIV